jgi:hypothetical protein
MLDSENEPQIKITTLCLLGLWFCFQLMLFWMVQEDYSIL